MIGHLYTLLFKRDPVGPEPEPGGAAKPVYGSGKKRVATQTIRLNEQHTQHGNEAAIRFVIALAISGED